MILDIKSSRSKDDGDESDVGHGLGLDFKTTVINADLLDTTAVVDAYKVNSDRCCCVMLCSAVQCDTNSPSPPLYLF